jgi:kynurenine formamidase
MRFFSFFCLLLMVAACDQQRPATGHTSSPASFPKTGSWIDLTHNFDENTIFWPTAEKFMMETVFEGETEKGYYYSAYQFCAAEHGGTHLDAPIHFSEGKQAVEEIPLDNLIGPAVVIDVSEKALKDADYQFSVADIETWEAKNGRIPDGSILLIQTGYGQYWPDAQKYLGTDERGEQAVAKLHFPGIHPDAARWIVANRKIKSVGLDTPSIDYGQSSLFESHQILYEQNIPGFENVANLDQLPATGSQVIALPMKIKGGSGGPLRIIAWLP